MLDREKLLQHIQEQSLRDTVLKVLDQVHIVLRKHEVRSTNFLTPYEIKASCSILNSIQDIKYIVTGGYEEAERKVIVIFPDYLDENTIDIPLALIEIKNMSEFDKLDHRAYLGSILGTGLKREKIGDLIVHDNICQVILDQYLKDYVLFNLDKVGKVSVKVRELDFSEIRPPHVEYRTITGNVASLRLDAVLSLAFRVSREEAKGLILKERVSINWEQVTKVSYEVNEGDTISVKGKGRVIVGAIEGKTQSDRVRIRLLKPI